MGSDSRRGRATAIRRDGQAADDAKEFTEVKRKEEKMPDTATATIVDAPAKTTTYRGYVINYAPPPIGSRACDYQFVHVDYDGPEDRRCGFGPSKEACQLAIDEIEGDEQDICGFCGQPGADKVPHPHHWPGERSAGTDYVHAACEQEECTRAHSQLNNQQRDSFLRSI